MLALSRPIAHAALLAVLLGTSALTLPVYAADDSATSDTSAAAPAMTKADPADKMMKHVETRIKTLHDSLKITKDQDPQWETVAQTMRDNEDAIGKLIEARHANTGMTAIDDIKSYQAIAQAHADGLAKFITAFEPLYMGMSDDQKKSADAFFGKSQMHQHHMHKSATGSKVPAATK